MTHHEMHRMAIIMPLDDLATLDELRRVQVGLPSRSEMIRRLIRKAGRRLRVAALEAEEAAAERPGPAEESASAAA